MSGIVPVNFGGKDLYVPGAYGQRNTSAVNQGGASSSNLVLIGECRGGIPFNDITNYPNPADRINWVSNTQDLNNILRDGPAYYGALFALTPSNQAGVGAPSRVGVVRINSAVKGSSTVLDTEAHNLLTLTSKDYGLYTNQISRKIIAGSVKGKQITVKFADQTIPGDNITYELFTMQYIGTGTSCSLTLDPAGYLIATVAGAPAFSIHYTGAGSACTMTNNGTTLSTTATGASGDNISIALSSYTTVAALVAHLQTIANYTTVLIGNGNALTSQLAVIAGQDIKTSTYTETGSNNDDLNINLTTFDTVANLVAFLQSQSNYSVVLTGDGTALVSQLDKIISEDSISLMTAYTVKAILQACIDWINNSSVYLNATLATGAVNREPAIDVDCVFLTGGSEGATPTQEDYQTAMDDILAANDISLCGVMTNDSGIQAALSAHVTYMSGIDGRNERQAIVGAASTNNKATKIAAAQALNNPLVAYCGTAIKRYNKNGNLTVYDGFYYAALLLGLLAGNGVTFSPTNKQLNIVGTNELYTDANDYIIGGVVIAAPGVNGGITTVRSVTTTQTPNKIDSEISAVRTSLFIVKDHRQYVQTLIGEPGDDTELESIKNRAELRLDYYVQQKYLVTDPQFGNAYRNFSFTVVGDVINISYEGTIVLPVNFILVQHNFTIIGVNK